MTLITKEPLYFLATFPDPNQVDAPRGGYRRNIEMLQLLKKHYHPTLIIAASQMFQLKTPMGIESIIFSHQRMPFRWIKIFKYLYKHCSPQTPLICYNPTLHTLPALLLCWLKYTVILDYVDIQGTVVESKNPFLRRLGVLIEKLFTRSCQHFITSSSAIQQRIRALNPKAHIHLYRGTFQPSVNVDKNTRMDLPSDIVKIMYLGMMQDFSGVRELLKAFIDLNPSNAHLYIVGHGPVKKECIHIAGQSASRTIFFPELDDAYLHSFMQQMDILTVPYLDAPRNQTNFPSKIIEYLWAGKAILGTQVGEIQHTLENERTALLTPPTSIGLRAGLQRLIEDRDLRIRLGQNVQDEFIKHYHPSTVYEALHTFVANATNKE